MSIPLSHETCIDLTSNCLSLLQAVEDKRAAAPVDACKLVEEQFSDVCGALYVLGAHLEVVRGNVPQHFDSFGGLSPVAHWVCAMQRVVKSAAQCRAVRCKAF
jgi:hypothetical protein